MFRRLPRELLPLSWKIIRASTERFTYLVEVVEASIVSITSTEVVESSLNAAYINASTEVVEVFTGCFMEVQSITSMKGSIAYFYGKV